MALSPCKEQLSKKTNSSDAEELPTSPIKTKDPKPMSKMSGVPKAKHPGRCANSFLPSSDYFDANTHFMETAQKSDETWVGLLECRVALEEERL